MPFYSDLPVPRVGEFKSPELQDLKSNQQVRLCDDPVKCGKQIFVGIFFDGTDNKKCRDQPLGAHTNVVRLHDAFPEHGWEKKYFKYYVPGVGTPFKEIGETEASIIGSPFGGWGAARIYWGLMQLMNGIHEGVFGAENKFISAPEALSIIKKLNDNDLSQSWNGKWLKDDLLVLRDKVTSLQKKLEAAPAPYLTQVNLSVFGFSRGAAQARTFCNWLKLIMEMNLGSVGAFAVQGPTGQIHTINNNSVNAFAGVEVSFDFLGIFDTVGSVGIADIVNAGFTNLGGHLSWALPEYLKIPSMVKKSVHLVAGTETRATFPVDLAGYAGNCAEYVYPGVHSDIGGGYPNGVLGIASNNYSRIPAQHMYYAAFRAGVPFLTPQSTPPIPSNTANDLIIDAGSAEVFNDYMKMVKEEYKPAGSTQGHCFTHTSLYLAARAMMSKEEGFPNADRLVKISDDILKLYYDLLEETANTSKYVPDPVTRKNIPISPYGLLVPKALSFSNQTEAMSTLATSIDVFTSTLSDEEPMANFAKADACFGVLSKMFTQNVHDSSAGFIQKLEDGTKGIIKKGEFTINDMGLLRYRRIFNNPSNKEENSIHIRPTPFKKTKTYKGLIEEDSE
jgi:hypothetical protein